jgi:hypothetical protein
MKMKRVIIFAIAILLILLLIDFIKFQNATNLLKTELVTRGFDTPIIFPSYRPFFWGRPIAGLAYRSMGSDQIEKPLYIRFRIGEHQAVMVWLNGENWFDYTVPKSEETRNKWYEQEFNSITGFIKILEHRECYDENYNKISKAKVLYYFETNTQKVYFAIQNMTLKRGGCDGGYWYGQIGEPF